MPALFIADTGNGCSRHVKDAFLQHTCFCGGSLGAAEPCGGCEGAAAAPPPPLIFDKATDPKNVM